MSTALSTFTEPTIVTTDDLNQRSYVTFYFNNERVREYHGKNIGQVINPNRAKSLDERNLLLKKLQFEIHKALDAKAYPFVNVKESPQPKQEVVSTVPPPALRLLFEAVRNKLRSDLSRTYKRDLKSVYRSFKEFLTSEESMGSLNNITSTRIEKFLSQYGSSGTYFMNKRHNLSILFFSSREANRHANKIC